MGPELTVTTDATLDQVETVRRQLDELIRMLQSDAYCVEVMKQIHTVQRSLERANRVTLHRHLETCFSDAVIYGRGQAAVDELVDVIKFSPASMGPRTGLNASAVSQAAAHATTDVLAASTLSLPGIASSRCKAALEAILTPIVGVGAVEVDLSAKIVTVHHDHRASSRRLIDAIEEQGYHVIDPLMTTTAQQTSNHGARWERGGAHTADRRPTTATALGQHDARLGFVDGDGI